MNPKPDLDARIDEYWLKLCDIVEKQGWMVQGVLGTEKTPSYSYTVGLSKYNLPEIMSIGLPHNVAQVIMNDAVKMLIEGKITTEPQKPIEGLANVPVGFRHDSETNALQMLARMSDRWASSRGIERPKVIQLVYADESGLLPWDPGCDEKIVHMQDPDVLLQHDYMPPRRPRPH